MVGVARQEGELPVLQLHNWANSPLVISLFQSAALAPSRNKICLLSCHHEALLIPLGFSLSSSLVNFSASISSDLPETFTVPGSIASCSTFTPGKDPQQEVLVEEVVSDNLESAVSSRESSRAVHIKSSSGVHIDSEFHRTPEYFIDRRGFANFQEYLVSEKLDIQSSSSQPTPLPSSTSSPSSAFLDPHQISRSPSPKHGATPDPQVSSSFPVLSDVECFSWACCGDEYEANQSSGPFSEILLTGGKEGLIIHAFCRKVGNQDRYENSESHDMGDCAQLHPLSEQYSSGRAESKISGSWRNWGLGEFQRRQERWRRLEEQSNSKKDMSDQVNLNYEQVYDHSGVLNANDSEGVRPPQSLEGVVRNFCAPECRKSGRVRRGLKSFVIDAKLDGNEHDSSLVYDKHQSWPLSAEIVSFRLAQGSSALSRLVSLARKTSLESQDHRNYSLDQNKDNPTPRHSASAWTRLKDGYFSTSKRQEGSHEVVGIISSPSQNLVAVMFSAFRSSPLQEEFTEPRASETVGRNNSNASCEGVSDGKRWKRSWRESFDLCVITATVNSLGLKWASGIDFEHARREGKVSIQQWGDFKLSTDKFLGLTESGCVYIWTAITGNFLARIDAFQFCQVPLHNSRDTDERTESKADSTAARARRFEPKGRQKFVQLVVTPDCSLVSVTNELGVVFLVSVDDYFLAHPQPFNTDPICSETDCYRKHKTLSSWEIAGSSIGNAAPVEGHSKDQLKMRVSSFGPNQGVTHKNLAAVGLFREDSTVILPTAGLNGFSSRVTQNDHEQRCTGTVDSSFKPLRQVFLPLNQNYSFVEMALNSYSITRLAINFKDRSKFTVVQNQLRISGGPFDEAMLSRQELSAVEGRLIKQHRYEGEVLSFTSQGCLYLVTATALHVVLPPLAFPSCQSGLVFPRDIPSWPSDLEIGMLSNKGIGLLPLLSRSHVQQWQSEVQDRSLIFDGLEEIERLCGENGWNLQLLRLRRLQLALDYVQIDKIEQALEGLVDVGAAEAGMPRVLFAAVELILAPYGTDNELVLASRLLSIAAQFSTRLVRRHAVAGARLRNRSSPRISTFPLSFESLQGQSASTFPNGVAELSRFIVVIRTLQEHLQAKRKGRSRSFKMSRETSFASRSASFKNRPIVEFPNESGSSDSNDYGNQIEHAKSLPSTADGPYLLMSQGVLTTTSSSLGAKSRWNQGAPEEVKGRRPSVESADEMFARWENTSVDAESVVRDALIAGRIPLAVVQLHRMLSRASLNSSPGCQPQIVDVFKDVQEISRGIVYELLCKGKMALAMAALRRLGEDIETALYQLAFGTVRRSLRKQTKKELLRHVRLGTLDSRLLGITTYLEGLYPHSSFWTSYAARQGQVATKEPIIEPVPSDDEKQSLRLICKSNLGGVFSLECGDRDVVVLGSWNTTKNSEAMEDSGSGQHITPPGYFVVAAVWLHAWNQPTVNRVILDRLHVANDHIPWVSLLEYHVAHHNWPSVSTLLDNIPETFLNSGVLHVLSDDNISSLRTQSKYPLGRASHQDITVPKVNYLRIDSLPLTSEWMVRLMEVKLARDLIFLRLYWERTALLSLLAAAGVLFMPSFDRSRTTKCKELVLATSMASKSFTPFKFHREAVQGVHELVIRHCVRLLLPHLLERYLAHHLLGLSKTSLTLLESYVGNCEWTRWELLSRLRGHEFDASLANFRSISTPNSSPGCKYVSMDDIAAAGQGLVVLATLMFAPVPLQKCLFFDHKMNGQEGQTWQCTLGNLREILQEYPTFCQTLEAASRGQDAWGFYSVRSSNSEETIPDISSYLLWRETIHSSVAGDAHLLHILPRWVPKSIQRLLQIVLKVPGGGSQGSLNQGGNFPVGNLRSSDQELGADLDEGVLQWEARVQTVIKQELYAPTTEEIEPGVEHYLRRGRALAAFNTLLGSRVLFLEPDTEGTGKSSQPPEYSKLLDSLSERDETLIASVYEFAISNFENSITVAACSLFLELCGVSAQMLRVDIAVLQRIAKYIRVKEQRDWASSSGANPPQVKLPSTVSLVRELAEEYATYSIKHPVGDLSQSKSKTNAGLVSTLQMLEKATLSDYSPKTIGGTPGSWLSNAAGNGDELRELQRSLSERWSLVTAFCRGHGLPLSTTYLVALARDNDWVGFLAEAQAIGCPLEVLINLASNEFTDPRLRCHILILLESLRTPSQTQTRPDFQEASRRGLNSTIPEDLFGLLAECEGKECPGADLLAKSEELQWPLLAVVASCFDDVKPISCLSIWLKITVSREVFGKSLKSKADEQLTATVGAAVEATNLEANTSLDVQFDRSNPKRQRYSLGSTAVLEKNDQIIQDIWKDGKPSSIVSNFDKMGIEAASDMAATEDSLAGLVALLCEHQLFLPLLQSFELFTPSSSVIPFIRFLQAFAQMRLTDASSELSSFSSLLKQESNKNAKSKSSWISRTAVAAAAAMLEACPSVYERRCLLELLSAVDFCDSGIAALKFRRLLRKLLLVEPSLSAGKETVVNGPYLGDDELLASLEASGLWDEGRMWAQQLDLKDHRVSSALHHVTETQAEAMVAEWKELLWDVQTERAALWDHCQALFVRHSFPPLQAGTFFLKHADTVENEVSKLEMQNILVLAFQWLSGSFTNSSPVYPIHLLHELEIRIWLLAVEAEVGMQNSTDEVSVDIPAGGHTSTITSMSPVDRTAETVSLVDLHLRNMTLMNRKEHSSNVRDTSSSNRRGHSSSPHKIRRKLKHSRHTAATADTHRTALQSKLPDSQDDKFSQLAFGETQILKGGTGSLSSAGSSNDLDSLNQSELIGSSVNKQDGSFQSGVQYGSWEERIGEGEVDRAVLALVEVGQVAAAKQLQQKLSPEYVPLELLLVEDAKKIASISEPDADESFIWGLLHPRVLAVLSNVNFASTISSSVPMQILNACAEVCREGCGRGLCRRIAAIAHISKYLDLHFTEAFEKHPVDLLQLLSFKGHEALKEATLLVSTHSMAAPAIARVLSETFYKGLAAAYRGGYSEMTETDEGPGPLLWRVSDFKQWAQLCPSESEIGHALMRLVISSRDLLHPCEVELLILAFQYYVSSECLDGLDVLVGFAATRVDSYNSEADFASLSRLVVGLHSLLALRFILDILVENGQLELLLQKTTWLDVVDADRAARCAVQGFHMGILSALNHFSTFDQDAFATVYAQFNMTYENAALLKKRAERGVEWWVKHPHPESSEELLETMRLFVEAADLYSAVDAGNSTSWCCAQASMISLQLRMPELIWLNLTETNARRLLIDQPRFAEALIVAEAYDLNQSTEWVPVLWNQMLQSSRIDQFLNDFVAILPLPATMLLELARFYRAEISARGYQLDFTKWLTPGAVPMELSRHLGKSMRALLKQVSNLSVRLQLATLATGFADVVDSCMQLLDRVPDTAGPLILRKGHGGAYIPLM